MPAKQIFSPKGWEEKRREIVLLLIHVSVSSVEGCLKKFTGN